LRRGSAAASESDVQRDGAGCRRAKDDAPRATFDARSAP
jgi:hypothetical protein